MWNEVTVHLEALRLLNLGNTTFMSNKPLGEIPLDVGIPLGCFHRDITYLFDVGLITSDSKSVGLGIECEVLSLIVKVSKFIVFSSKSSHCSSALFQ